MLQVRSLLTCTVIHQSFLVALTAWVVCDNMLKDQMLACIKSILHSTASSAVGGTNEARAQELGGCMDPGGSASQTKWGPGTGMALHLKSTLAWIFLASFIGDCHP